jgi:hypothetical protein
VASPGQCGCGRGGEKETAAGEHRIVIAWVGWVLAWKGHR